MGLKCFLPAQAPGMICTFKTFKGSGGRLGFFFLKKAVVEIMVALNCFLCHCTENIMPTHWSLGVCSKC